MHKIDIPRRIIDRGIARRGTRQVYGTLDPVRTALLVIDMQNCFLVPGFSVLEVPDSRAIVDNVNALAAAVEQAHAFSGDPGLIGCPSQHSHCRQHAHDAVQQLGGSPRQQHAGGERAHGRTEVAPRVHAGRISHGGSGGRNSLHGDGRPRNRERASREQHQQRSGDRESPRDTKESDRGAGHGRGQYASRTVTVADVAEQRRAHRIADVAHGKQRSPRQNGEIERQLLCEQQRDADHEHAVDTESLKCEQQIDQGRPAEASSGYGRPASASVGG